MYLYMRLTIILKSIHVNKVIQTNLKKRSFKKLFLDLFTKTSFRDGTIKFYGCFVDDTLVFIKPKEIGCVHQTLNNFDKSLCFTVDTFGSVLPHYLYLVIRNDGMALYKKPTNTGLYVNCNSYVP